MSVHEMGGRGGHLAGFGGDFMLQGACDATMVDAREQSIFQVAAIERRVHRLGWQRAEWWVTQLSHVIISTGGCGGGRLIFI